MRERRKNFRRVRHSIIVNLTSRFWWINKGDLDICGCVTARVIACTRNRSVLVGARLRELSDGGSIYASTINPRPSGGIIF